MRYKKSEDLLKRALKTIPLASQTFSKSITQFPQGVSPLFIEKGRGCKVWDADNNEYFDFMNGLLSVMLGYNDPDVDEAISQQLKNGISFSLPHKLEMEVAEILCDYIPCAEMVRFGKNGTDATSGAIRLARAFTGRDHVALCGYHGWQDWSIGTTTRNLGVPNAVRELSHVFTYNDLSSLELIMDEFDLAAVIMEPMNVTYPKKGFLESVRKLSSEKGTLLVFDETITGCRFSRGGAQEEFGVTPDLATFGKGIANGMPLSAVVGRRDIMKLMEDIFFSGTFGGETLSLAAAKASLLKIDRLKVNDHIKRYGAKLTSGIDRIIQQNSCEDFMRTSGHPAWSFFVMDGVAEYGSSFLKTFFLQEMFKRGIITLGTHNLSYAHEDESISALLSAYNEVICLIKESIDNNSLKSKLKVEPLVPLFKVR